MFLGFVEDLFLGEMWCILGAVTNAYSECSSLSVKFTEEVGISDVKILGFFLVKILSWDSIFISYYPLVSSTWKKVLLTNMA